MSRTEAMATILDTLKKGTEYLQRHGVDEARLNMELLIGHVLKVERMRLYLDFDRPLPENHLATLRELTRRRGQGEPLQHLLGTVEFCERDFKVDHRALIPRPETEELTHFLLAREWPDSLEILDLGCGSGVIGISLAVHLARPGLELTLADLSPEALDLARENAAALLPPDLVAFVQSDLFTGLHGRNYDLIAANLPYISDSARTELSREVQRDPAMALYGGEQGTEIMERFLGEVCGHLRDGGRVAMEFGIDQGPDLARIATDAGLDEVELRRDLSGIERFLFATKSTHPC